MNREKTFAYYLLAISSLGMLFAFIVTFRFGAGLATDGSRYLSTAESLINGNGFTEYLGVPLTQLSALKTHTPVFLSAGQNVISAANASLSIDYYVRDGGNGQCVLPQ